MQKVKLGDICEKGSSNIAQKDVENNSGNYPIYGAAGLIKYVDFYQQEKEYIAVVKDGAGIGRAMRLPAKSSVIGTMQYIFPKENVSIDYLFYLLSHLNLAKYFSGATIPHIYFKDYKNEEVNLPHIEEQKAIAEKLDKVSILIEKRKQQLSLLDTLVKSKFVEMFGDYELGTNKYETKKLGDLSIKITDGVHAKPIYVETGKPFLSVQNINRGVIDFTDCKFVSEEAYQRMIKSTFPKKGDVLYTKVGATYGIPAYVDTDIPFCLYVSVCLIKPNRLLINSRFLSASMGMSYVKEQADRRVKGIGVPDLHLNQIREFDIILPPIEVQNEFVIFLEKTDKLKQKIKQSLAALELLKKSLMQKYFG